MRLTEEQISTKVIELLDGMDQERMDRWFLAGTIAGRIDSQIAERVLRDEVKRRPHKVVMFWMGECNCDGHLN